MAILPIFRPFIKPMYKSIFVQFPIVHLINLENFSLVIREELKLTMRFDNCLSNTLPIDGISTVKVG